MLVAVVVAAAAWGAPLSGQAPAGLEGAWRVTEVVTTGPGGGRVASPQPGLLLFAGRHYSYTFVTSDGPRPMLALGPTTTTDLLSIWNPFTANAGTFEVAGNTMTRRPIVAKNPDAMAPGVFNEYTFRLVGDTLWTTTVRTEEGPVTSPSTVKYVRAR